MQRLEFKSLQLLYMLMLIVGLETRTLDVLLGVELGRPLGHDLSHLLDLGAELGVGIDVLHPQLRAVRAVLDDEDGRIRRAVHGTAGAERRRHGLGSPGVVLAVDVDEAGGVDNLPAGGLLDDLLGGLALLQAVLEAVGVGEEVGALVAQGLGGEELGDEARVAGVVGLPVLEAVSLVFVLAVLFL